MIMGNAANNWTNKDDGSIATSLQMFRKKSYLYSAAPTTSVGESDCKVILTGNTGTLRGGAIGNNGDVTISRDDSSVEHGTITVKKDWNAIPEVDMFNEVYRLLYSVYFDLYCREEGTQEWTLMDTDSSNLQTDGSWGDVKFTNLIMEDEQGMIAFTLADGEYILLSGLSGSGLLALTLTGRRKREDEE